MAKRVSKAVGQSVQMVPVTSPTATPAPAFLPSQQVASFGGIPQMNYQMSFKELGTSGLRQFAGWIREDFLPELQGRQGARTYREMADNSPIIGGILFSIVACMRKVTWRVNSASDTPEATADAEFMESVMDDMATTWEDVVVESLSMLTFGYAPMELVYKLRNGQRPIPTADDPDPAKSKFDDGLIGWRRIGLRGQDTVLKWFLGQNDQIMGLTQQPYVGPIRNIPIEKMLLFRPSQYKGNPEGHSILRNSYRPYWFVKRMEEQEAITYERLNGLPIVRLPAAVIEKAAGGDAAAAAVLAGYKAMAINLRINDQMGVVMPSDRWPGTMGQPSAERMYELDLLTPGNGSAGRGASSANEAIDRHSTNMMLSTMTDFLKLGHETNGTQALSVNKTDMFLQAVEGYLNSNAAVINRYGIPRLWALNGKNPDTMPTVQPDLAQRVDLDILSNYVLRLTTAGMNFFPNEDIERAMLDAAGLPEIDDGALAALEEAAATPAPLDPATGLPDQSQAPVGKMILRAMGKRMGLSANAARRKRRRK